MVIATAPKTSILSSWIVPSANHPALAGHGAEHDRDYLFTVVHELGHAFNLLHSFQKHIFQEGRRELLPAQRHRAG